ncbi:MAG: hypothetical protein SFT94_07640 [Pseudanabaenaceae cyanobacterium bins.68]|nr:hypothetical protein [Pseudanabaenaceae cyanobacterium bins.68]
MQLRLQPDSHLIGFYRLDNEQKLLPPDELLARVEQERARADQLAEKLRSLGVEV